MSNHVPPFQNASRNHPPKKPHMSPISWITSTILFAHWQERPLREIFLYSADVCISSCDSSAYVLLFFHLHISYPYLNLNLLVDMECKYPFSVSRVLSSILTPLHGDKFSSVVTCLKTEIIFLDVILWSVIAKFISNDYSRCLVVLRYFSHSIQTQDLSWFSICQF